MLVVPFQRRPRLLLRPDCAASASKEIEESQTHRFGGTLNLSDLVSIGRVLEDKGLA